jgi:hypothetical protein
LISWVLPSNSGWNVTSWLIRDAVIIRRRRFLLTELVLTGRYWNRLRSMDSSYNVTKEYSVILSQFLLSESQLKKLQKELAKWLKTPIRRLGSTPLDVTQELAGLEGQSLIISFHSEGVGSARLGHAYCKIAYRYRGLTGECEYILDQFCIHTFVEGINNYFKQKTRR